MAPIIETTDFFPSKPCEYRGINFRSKLEARWAQWLDGIGISYKYEEKSFNMDGLWYCPDFYLPDYRVYLEIKGLMDSLSLEKITTFASHAYFSHQLLVGFSEVGRVVDATYEYYQNPPGREGESFWLGGGSEQRGLSNGTRNPAQPKL